jgi:hypothetical protein
MAMAQDLDPEAPPPERPGLAVAIDATLVLIRVTVIIAVWLAVFVITFTGYLTIPALLLAGFLILWGITTWLQSWRRRRADHAE